MGKISKKKKSKKMTTKKKTKKKMIIKNPPMSTKINLGTFATTGGIDYHYQDSMNIIYFIRELMKQHKNLYKHICIPRKIIDWNEIKIDKKYQIITKSFDTKASKCLQKSSMIPVSILIEHNDGLTQYHSNLLLINTKTKQLELFEPKQHYKPFKRAYKALEKYMKGIFPEYDFIHVSDFISCPAFQNKYDTYSGMCLSWSALYLHYRILNIKHNYKDIIRHMNKYITLIKLLNHAKYVEDIIKLKI